MKNRLAVSDMQHDGLAGTRLCAQRKQIVVLSTEDSMRFSSKSLLSLSVCALLLLASRAGEYSPDEKYYLVGQHQGALLADRQRGHDAPPKKAGS